MAPHQADDPFDEIVHVLHAPRLAPLAVDGEGFAGEGLLDKVRHHPAVVGAHPRAEGVEDAHDAGVHAVVAVVGHGDRLRVALGLVVDAADTDGVDVAPVTLVLGVDERVAVDLGGRGEHEAGPPCEGETQGVVGPHGADLEDRDGDALEVHGARG